MKKIIVLVAAVSMAIAPSAFAQTVSGSNSNSSAGSQAVVTQNSKGAKVAASAIAPSFSSGVDCNGVGIGVAMSGFGISLGGPSGGGSPCDVREDSKYILAITGSRAAATERLCDNRRNRAAMARAGIPCADDRRVASARSSSAIRSNTRTYGAPITTVSASDPVLAAWCERQPVNKRPARCR